VPLVETLAVAEGAVEHGDAVAEARGETLDGLRGEGDLGDKDDRPAPLSKRVGDGLQVDLGLA
jgi:hypothetical protein